MATRWKPNQKSSQRSFVKSAVHTNYKNVAPAPMRGGYRI